MKRSATRGVLSLVAGTILLMSLRGEAAAALTGNWGCLGTVTFSFANGQAQQTIPNQQLMQLSISPAAPGVVSGTVFFGLAGAEVCDFAAKGTITVNASGVGLLALTFSTNIEDEDKDLNCTSFFNGRTSVTETFHIVAVKSNTQFYFFGKDDFLTPSTADNGDFLSTTGECTQQ